jgi:TPR repeat protein
MEADGERLLMKALRVAKTQAMVDELDKVYKGAATYYAAPPKATRPMPTRRRPRLFPPANPTAEQAAQSAVDACRGSKNAKACFDAGHYYGHQVEGRSGPRDSSLALSMYRIGCNRGDPRACQNAGLLLLASDLGTALKFFKTSCEEGDSASCVSGAIHTSDPTKSAELHLKACAAGVLPSCHNAAVKFEEAGQTERAHQAYVNACKRNVRPSCVKLEEESSLAGGPLMIPLFITVILVGAGFLVVRRQQATAAIDRDSEA